MIVAWTEMSTDSVDTGPLVPPESSSEIDLLGFGDEVPQTIAVTDTSKEAQNSQSDVESDDTGPVVPQSESIDLLGFGEGLSAPVTPDPLTLAQSNDLIQPEIMMMGTSGVSDGSKVTPESGNDLLDMTTADSAIEPESGAIDTSVNTGDQYLGMTMAGSGSLEPSDTTGTETAKNVETIDHQDSAVPEVPDKSCSIDVGEGENTTIDLVNLSTDRLHGTDAVDNEEHPSTDLTKEEPSNASIVAPEEVEEPLREFETNEGILNGASDQVVPVPVEREEDNEPFGHRIADKERVLQSPTINGGVDESPRASDELQKLQNQLQQEIDAKVQAESRAKLAESKVADLETTSTQQLAQISQLQSELQTQNDEKESLAKTIDEANRDKDEMRKLNEKLTKDLEQYSGLQGTLQSHMESRAEAENSARLASQKLEASEKSNEEFKSQIETLQAECTEAKETIASMQGEVNNIRFEREDYHRKVASLTNRLNGAKKKEADKANDAERFEEQAEESQKRLSAANQDLERLKGDNDILIKKLEELEKTSTRRIEKAERTLADEVKLAEDRKRKMKAFVESKAEELRQAKEDNESLQAELDETSRSLVDLNNRWKQLNAQWLQSQTRNRELQRDLNKIKKDSENWNKIGGSLEMKLSRSANETEEHKSKRLAAKNELMNVLKSLEEEREKSSALRESIKFTFTPKALSQQQLLREYHDDFRTQLSKLAMRLGKQLVDNTDTFDGEDLDGSGQSSTSDAEVDAKQLIAKLDHETQRLSKCIMTFSSSIEQMQEILDSSVERTCFSALSEIVTTGTISTLQSQPSTNSATRPLAAIRSSGYGQVPRTAEDT